jgi:hypothetical protein
VLGFPLGWWIRGPWWHSALAGGGGAVVAAPVHHVSTWLIQHDDLAMVEGPAALIWMTFGLIAGAGFGTAGSWARSNRWRRLVGSRRHAGDQHPAGGVRTGIRARVF